MAETDDLVQVTLIRALRRAPTFEHRREVAFLAYLRTILMNVVREEVRRSRALMAREQEFDVPIAEAASELERLIGRERIEAYDGAGWKTAQLRLRLEPSGVRASLARTGRG